MPWYSTASRVTWSHYYSFLCLRFDTCVLCHSHASPPTWSHYYFSLFKSENYSHKPAWVQHLLRHGHITTSRFFAHDSALVCPDIPIRFLPKIGHLCALAFPYISYHIIPLHLLWYHCLLRVKTISTDQH